MSSSERRLFAFAFSFAVHHSRTLLMQGWRTAAGPITYDSLYNGEAYDSRVAAALDGWSLPAFNDAAWVPAAVANSVANNATLSSQSFEPIRHIATFQPLSVTTPANDTQVFALGRTWLALYT